MKIIHRNVNEQDYKRLVLCEGVNIPSHPQKTFELFKELMVKINNLKDIVIDTTVSKNKQLKEYDFLMKHIVNHKNYALVINKKTQIIYLYDMFFKQKFDYYSMPHYNTLKALKEKIRINYLDNLKKKLRTMKDLYYYFSNKNNDIIFYDNINYYDHSLRLIKPIEIVKLNNSFSDMYLRYRTFHPYSKTFYPSTEHISLSRGNNMFFNMNVGHTNITNTVIDANHERQKIYILEQTQKAKDFMNKAFNEN